MPCLPVDPEIPLLRIYPKEISMGRFGLCRSCYDIRCSKIIEQENSKHWDGKRSWGRFRIALKWMGNACVHITGPHQTFSAQLTG